MTGISGSYDIDSVMFIRNQERRQSPVICMGILRVKDRDPYKERSVRFFEDPFSGAGLLHFLSCNRTEYRFTA